MRYKSWQFYASSYHNFDLNKCSERVYLLRNAVEINPEFLFVQKLIYHFCTWMAYFSTFNYEYCADSFVDQMLQQLL